MRLLMLTLVFFFLPLTLPAQESQDLTKRLADLERRVSQLETENRSLRGTLSVLKYVQQSEDGHTVELKQQGELIAKLIVARDGWGDSRVEDVAAVAESVAETIFEVIPPEDKPTILVTRSKYGPRTLSNRGPNNEYIIFLNTGDRLWAQLSYQLSHELGHVLCRDIDPNANQHWFEESFCEALSLWTMETMAQSWKTKPPYPSWASYAKNLGQYVVNIKNKVNRPQDMGIWYATHRELLDRESVDREKNRIVAAHIASRGKARPEYLNAFLYLRTGRKSANQIEPFLNSWLESCPDHLKFVPRDIALLLNVQMGR